MKDWNAIHTTWSALALCTLVLALLMGAPSESSGYSAEPDTAIGAQGDNDDGGLLAGGVSTHHTHLTRALAVCAGFSHSTQVDPLDDMREAETIAIFDELTDAGTIPLAGGGTVSNCTARPYEPMDKPRLGCPRRSGDALTWPMQTSDPGSDPASGCFSNRFSAQTSTFHMPTENDLANLRAWAFGETGTLLARWQYAWGDDGETLLNSDCYIEEVRPLDTGTIVPGSLEALGTYLHALADWHSHGACRESWGDRKNPPWYTHTFADAGGLENCSFANHLAEYGCPQEATFAPTATEAINTARVIEAGIAVHQALVDYAQSTGRLPRIADVDDHGGWLRRQIERFVLHYSPVNGGAQRAQFAHELMLACEAVQVQSPAQCLPDVAGPDATSPGATCFYPLTPECEPPSLLERFRRR